MTEDLHAVIDAALKFGFDGVDVRIFNFLSARKFVLQNAPKPAVAVRLFDVWRLIIETLHTDHLELDAAWGLIANAYNGDWATAPKEWREAAERWRDRYVNRGGG